MTESLDCVDDVFLSTAKVADEECASASHGAWVEVRDTWVFGTGTVLSVGAEHHRRDDHRDHSTAHDRFGDHVHKLVIEGLGNGFFRFYCSFYMILKIR